MRSSASTVRRLIAGLTLSAGLLASSVAAASGVAPNDASAEQKAQAMTHFTAGKLAIDQKNWEKAAIELRESLDVVNSPNARLVLARALRDAGNFSEAWAEYGRTIADATALAATEERYAKTAEAATTERGELEPKLAFVVVTVANAPADATVKAGGRVVTASEANGPVVVPAGAVDVVLTDAAGKELARQTVSATVGQKTPVTLDAQPVATPKPPTEVAKEDKADEAHVAEPPPPASNGSKLRMYSYVAGGVGVAGLALFTVFGLIDNSTYRDLQSSCPHNACPPSKQGEIDSGRTQQTVANVSLVVGGLGVAAGATLFVLSLSSKPSSNTGLVVAPGYLGVRGSL
ncbi:MAG TPA: hypothetical protein VHS09_05240 [Polyangiaceae bacterium]|nr:hypothetical protein [Polyangiaceae bacterium]